MDKLPRKPKKVRNQTKEELQNLDKDELIDKIIQLEAHNLQLKNIISKNLSDGSTKGGKNYKNKPFDFSKYHSRRILLHIMYFGWDYQGLADQEDTTQTIEYHLFHALTKSCLIERRQTAQYHRCGRTDKGVSSFGQVISISLRSKFPTSEQYEEESIANELPYCKILNRLLPKEIKVVGWRPIPGDNPEFSARFDCNKRQYKYYFPRSSLNLCAMRAACRHLLGSNDYRNLCKMDVGNGVMEYIRNILKAEILPFDDKDTEKPTSMFYLLIEGNAFLWHQIRCIMGILFLVGQGKETEDIITQLLDVENNPRKPQYDMALDLPLNLFHCSYELPDKLCWVYDRDELAYLLSQIQSEWTLYNVRTTMIKDVINELEKLHSQCASGTADTGNASDDKDSVIAYSDCLLQGVKPKIYTPLLKRKTCLSLEDRVEYYRKKKKICGPEETAE